MNADQHRAFLALHLGAAPRERLSWASFRKAQRDRVLLSATVAMTALATTACGGTTDSEPDDESAGTGGAPTDDETTGGATTGGWQGLVYGMPYETGGGSGGSGGLDSGGTGGLGMGGTLYGIGGLVELGGTGGAPSGGTGGVDFGGTGGLGLGGTVYGIGGLVELGGTGGASSGGTGGPASGGTGGLGMGGVLYGTGGLVELGGTAGTGGLGLGGTAYGIPYEYDCWDGYDSDYDGLVDCQDPDCDLECQGWLGCDATGAVCSEFLLDVYLTDNPDCQPAASNCDLFYPCGTSCPLPDPSQVVPPSGDEWKGCTEDGFAVCVEVVRDIYFEARPQCAEAACGNGPYFPCAPLCGERAINEYPPGSADNWSGCRGNGIAVCTELANATYFVDHPACIPNDTCAGAFSACNEICPPPTDTQTP